MTNYTDKDIIIQKPIPGFTGRRVFRAYLVDCDGKGITRPVAATFNLDDTIELALLASHYDTPMGSIKDLGADLKKQPISQIPDEYKEVLEFYHV